MAAPSNFTRPTQMRLTADDLAILDEIRAHLGVSRTAAFRVVVRDYRARRLRGAKNSPKKATEAT